MKKWISTITFTVFVLSAFAQKRVTFGIRGGYAGYIIHGKHADGRKFNLRPEEGFSIGTDIEFPIGKNVYLQPGIMYNQKGSNFNSYHYMGQVFHGDVKLSYVEIPVHIVFKPRLGSGHLMIGAGPYLGKGVGREAGVDQGIYNIRFTMDVSSAELAESPFYFSPWDAGASFFVGYQLHNNLFVQLNNQVGMKRINPSVNGQWEGKTKHRNLGLGMSVGYRF
jgi:hypothetical protein